MSMNVNDVMDGIGTRLRTIEGLRVWDYLADNISTPAAVVTFPESIEYDATMDRGADRAPFEVVVIVSRNSDRAARDALSDYMSGTGANSIKTAIEADVTLGGAADTARVTEARVEFIKIAAVDYLAATILVDVVA